MMLLAKKFAKLYNTKPMVYWDIVEWRQKLSFKDIHSRLVRRHINISYWSTWYWTTKGIKQSNIKTKEPLF